MWAPSSDLLVFCRGFCTALSGHHKSEGAALFPSIVESRPDLEPVIAKLVQDHSMIDYLINELEHALDSGAGREEVLRHIDGIEAVMETHFRYEERQLIDVLNAIDDSELDPKELFGPLA